MLPALLHRARHLARRVAGAILRPAARWVRPATAGSVVLGAAVDLVRSKEELVAENALLRQQLIVLARSTRRPHLTGADRALLVVLASRVRAWRQALVILPLLYSIPREPTATCGASARASSRSPTDARPVTEPTR